MLENNQKEIILLKELGYLYPNELSKQKRRYGIYKCFCGNEFKAQEYSIKSRVTQSCGCLKKINFSKYGISNITHGLTNHRLYGVWHDMVRRCTNPKRKAYKDYGARGITVCDEWLDINNFINDMYPSYQEGLTLDRIDNDKGYSKDNCRWATKATQSRNKRKLITSNKSGYRGVSWISDRKIWKASIRAYKKSIHLGNFKNKLEAAHAYDNYVIKNNLEHTRNF